MQLETAAGVRRLTSRGSQLTAACGIAYVLFAMIGNPLRAAGGETDPAAPAAVAGAWLIAHPPDASRWAGELLVGLAFLCAVPFVVRLHTALRAAEGGSGLFSTIALDAGLVMIAVGFAAQLPVVTAFYYADKGLDPELAGVLLALNDFAFVSAWAIYSLLLAASAVVILRARALPRWLGWSAAAIAVLLLGSVPFAISGPPTFILFFAWVVVTSVVLIRPSVDEGVGMPVTQVGP
jgi:hypothetical protein